MSFDCATAWVTEQNAASKRKKKTKKGSEGQIGDFMPSKSLTIALSISIHLTDAPDIMYNNVLGKL